MHVRGCLDLAHERMSNHPVTHHNTHARDRTSKHGRTCGCRKDLACRGRRAEYHGSTARHAEDELDRDSVRPGSEKVDAVRDGIRAGLGMLAGMRGSARAGFGARLQLTLTTSTLTRSAARRSRPHVDLWARRQVGAGSWPLPPAEGRHGRARREAWAREVGWWCRGGRGEQPRCEIRLTGRLGAADTASPRLSCH